MATLHCAYGQQHPPAGIKWQLTRARTATVHEMICLGFGNLSASKPGFVTGQSYRIWRSCAMARGSALINIAVVIARDQRSSHEDRPSGRWPAIYCCWAFLVRTRDGIILRAAQCRTDRRRRGRRSLRYQPCLVRIAVAGRPSGSSALWRIRTFADFNVGIDDPAVILFSPSPLALGAVALNPGLSEQRSAYEISRSPE